MYSVDLHTHTRFFHGLQGRPTPFDPIGAQLLALCSQRAELDGVALTNHDYYSEFTPFGSRVQFIPGVEISTTVGHVLIIGPNPPARATPGVFTPKQAVSLAHDRGCAAIIAHPFRRSRVRESEAKFDAVEINGKTPDNIGHVRSLAESLGIPIVGGSDAHYPFEVGRAFTRIEMPELTPEAVVTAIQEGEVEAHVRDTRLDELMRAGYEYVHRYL